MEDLTIEQMIILGDVSDDPAGTIEDFQPMADYLAANLSDSGIKKGKVVVVPDIEEMKNLLSTGQVDIYFESPYGALTVYEETGAFPLARRWKKGVDEYYSLIVASKSSGITDTNGLLGKGVVFEDSGSTSGYLLPKAHLVGLGYLMTEIGSSGENAPGDSIGYYFSDGEENIIPWLLSGKADAGALPIANYDELSEEEKAQLTILAQTVPLPRHIVMVSPTMDQALRDKLFDVLVNLEQTDEGQGVLQSFEKTARFDQLPLGSEGTMQALRELFEPVR